MKRNNRNSPESCSSRKYKRDKREQEIDSDETSSESTEIKLSQQKHSELDSTSSEEESESSENPKNEESDEEAVNSTDEKSESCESSETESNTSSEDERDAFGDEPYICITCGKTFQTTDAMHAHIKDKHLVKKDFSVLCEYCGFSSKDRVTNNIHVNRNHKCHLCTYTSAIADDVLYHKLKCDVQLGAGLPDGKNYSPHPFVEIKAFQGYVKTYRHRFNFSKDLTNSITVDQYFKNFKCKIKSILLNSLKVYTSLKIQMSLYVQFFRPVESNKSDEFDHYLNSNMEILLNRHYFDELYSSFNYQMLNAVNIFEQNGSGWQIKTVLGSDLRLVGFEPLSGGCRLPIPSQISKKKCAINIQTDKKDCFKWAFLSSLHKALGHVSRPSSYKSYESLYDFSGVSFPMELPKIDAFEATLTDKKIAINIFGLDYNNSALPLRISKNAHALGFKVSNILYVKSIDQNLGHFVGIKTMSRLLGSTNKHKKNLCFNCLNRIPKHTRLSQHLKNCKLFKAQKIEMPQKQLNGKPPIIKFENFSNQLKAGFCIYADFETLATRKVKNRKLLGPKTDIYASHEPSGFSFAVIRSDGEVMVKETYRNPDCITVFFNRMDEVCGNILKQYANPIPMKELTREQLVEHFRSKSCFICEKPLSSADKVKEHDHLTGLYRGSAHWGCNLGFKQKHKVPIFFHSFRSFDSHLLIHGFKKFKGQIQVIPTNKEQYMSIICDQYMFLDSLLFLNAPLKELVKILYEDSVKDNNFKELFSPLVQVYGERNAKLLSRKGIYPYDYMRKWDNFQETKFPKIEKFYNTLTESHIDKKEYEYGKKIFDSYCDTLGDYHDLYLSVDTLLLACVFENFRKLGLKHFKLDPCYYFSLPGFTWDCSLKTTKVRLEKLLDMEAYNMLDLNLRGGVSVISKRKVDAKNRYLKNKSKGDRENYIMYFDKNSLYSESMLEDLPISDFKFVKKKDLRHWTKEKILSIPKDNKKGYIIECSLSYPSEIHDDTNCYPLAPEKITIPLEKLSPYQQKINKKLNVNYNDKIPKLIPHLGDRKFYVTHYRNLQYYLKKNMILDKVHRILEFTQSPWQSKFIKLCASQRAIATDKFKKDFWKSLMNVSFGKTCENLRRRKTVKIVNNLTMAKKLAKQNNFLSTYIIEDDLCVFIMGKNKVELNKPLYVGFTVLELSKLKMYEFHYEKMKKWFPNESVELLATDTDSFIYNVYCNDIYEKLKRHKDEFDFSDYPVNHPLYSDRNRKKIGKMKDEMNSKVVKHFVGISPKMYCLTGSGIEKKAAKGIKAYVIQSQLRYQIFKKVLTQQTKVTLKMNSIRSYRHKLYNITTKRASLCNFDSKRYILPDGITTYAFNHYRIKSL